jgi:hypothetical protein
MTEAERNRAVEAVRQYITPLIRLGLNTEMCDAALNAVMAVEQLGLLAGGGLFKTGAFVLHSGEQSQWKIDCDVLTDEDWATLAHLIADQIIFSAVEGVPEGGLKLAAALHKLCYETGPLLIVDDALTTGASMEKWRCGREAIGVVLFARGQCPAWVRPVFQFALAGGGVADGAESVTDEIARQVAIARRRILVDLGWGGYALFGNMNETLQTQEVDATRRALEAALSVSKPDVAGVTEGSVGWSDEAIERATMIIATRIEFCGSPDNDAQQANRFRRWREEWQEEDALRGGEYIVRGKRWWREQVRAGVAAALLPNQTGEQDAVPSRNDVLEEAMQHVRHECGACEGSGHADENTECEYCGRPMSAIHALKSKETKTP